MFELMSWAWNTHPFLTIGAAWLTFLAVFTVAWYFIRRPYREEELKNDLIALARQQ